VRRLLLLLGLLPLCALAVLAPGAGASSAAPSLGPATTRYLADAQRAIAGADHWRVGSWYDEYSPPRGPTPLATVWAVVGLMQAAGAVAQVDPSPANRARVHSLAIGAERFWNAANGGYAPYPGWRSPSAELWFDDNGWLGLAFLSAYDTLHDRRWLTDAQRAFSFIMRRGWVPQGGGLWWNTDHQGRAGEAMAAGSLLGALLARDGAGQADAAAAQRIVDWMNNNDIKGVGLYGSLSSTGNAAVDYIQAPMIEAEQLLCGELQRSDDCDQAASIADATQQSYGTELNFAPQYDAIFLQWMMAYGEQVRDGRYLRWAVANANAAESHARTGGQWLGSWWGGRIGDSQTGPGMLRTEGATASLFATVALYASHVGA
jgi:hypothetical protein